MTVRSLGHVGVGIDPDEAADPGILVPLPAHVGHPLQQVQVAGGAAAGGQDNICLLYTSPSPRD